MNENMSYGMTSYKLIKNDELIKKLKEKDVHFVQFCLGIYGSVKTKKEKRVAIEEDFVFFLSGLHEIQEIISDLTKKMEESTNEEEKRELLEELNTWKKERNDYYRELSKIEKQIEKAHELKENGRNFLNEEKSLEYARMIYLITVYDQQKQKIVLDGKTKVSELESVVSTLHSIQDKLNLLYQATYGVTDLLEEKDVIPRIRVSGETDEEYEKYLYQFYHKENLLPKVSPKESIPSEMTTTENTEHLENTENTENVSVPFVPETTNEDENVLAYSDGYENGLTYSLGEKMPDLNLEEESYEYDSWLEHLDTFLNNRWVLKTFSYFDERIENFKKILNYIQIAREDIDYEKYPHQIMYEGLLSNGHYMGELEITNPQEFEKEKEILLENVKDYQAEFQQFHMDSQNVEFYSQLSSLFQAIYLYDKKVHEYTGNLNEKEEILNIYHYINNHAKELFHVENFIPSSELPFVFDEPLQEDNQYANIFKTPDENNLTLDDFMTTGPVSTADVSVSDNNEIISKEEHEKLLNENEDYKRQLAELQAEKERILKEKEELLKENEELKSKNQNQQRQVDQLISENEMLQDEIDALNEKKYKRKGKPFRVIREKAHDLWEKVNKRNVMYAAIGIVSLVMIGTGAMKWKEASHTGPNEAIENVETPTLANDNYKKILTMYQKINELHDQQENEEIKKIEEIEENNEEIDQPLIPIEEETLYDSYTGPHIGDIVKISFGASTYTDFLVEKDPNMTYLDTGHQRVFRGNYSPDTEMLVLKVALIDPNDPSKTVIAKSNEEIKRYVNEGYQVLSAAVSLNTSLSSVADGLYQTNSKQVDDNVTFYVSAKNIKQEMGLNR